MNDEYASWSKSGHNHVAVCNDCHLPHALIPKFIAKARNSFPALLKLARAWLVERGGPSNEALDALEELADAVLGPAPTPEEQQQ